MQLLARVLPVREPGDRLLDRVDAEIRGAEPSAGSASPGRAVDHHVYDRVEEGFVDGLAGEQ